MIINIINDLLHPHGHEGDHHNDKIQNIKGVSAEGALVQEGTVDSHLNHKTHFSIMYEEGNLCSSYYVSHVNNLSKEATYLKDNLNGEDCCEHYISIRQDL